MSVALYNLYEMFEGRSYSKGDGGLTITRSFRVETADNECSPSVVAGAELNGVYIPQIGDNLFDSEGNDLGITCTSIDVQQTRAPRLWTVRCRYGNQPAGNQPLSEASGEPDPSSPPTAASQDYPPGYGGGPSGEGAPSTEAVTFDDPFARPATVRYFGVKRQEIIYADPDFEEAMKNAAGDPFDPPPQHEVARLGMTVTRNKARFQADVLMEYVGSINDANWAGNPPRSVRCTDIAAERKYENGVWYFEVSYTFEFERNKWNPKKYLNAGPNALVAGVKQRIAGAAKGEFLGKVLLTAAGAQLAVGAAPTWVSIDIYHQKDFNALKLFART